jgi:hypothetical protein
VAEEIRHSERRPQPERVEPRLLPETPESFRREERLLPEDVVLPAAGKDVARAPLREREEEDHPSRPNTKKCAQPLRAYHNRTTAPPRIACLPECRES